MFQLDIDAGTLLHKSSGVEIKPATIDFSVHPDSWSLENNYKEEVSQTQKPNARDILFDHVPVQERRQPLAKTYQGSNSSLNCPGCCKQYFSRNKSSSGFGGFSQASAVDGPKSYCANKDSHSGRHGPACFGATSAIGGSRPARAPIFQHKSATANRSRRPRSACPGSPKTTWR